MDGGQVAMVAFEKGLLQENCVASRYGGDCFGKDNHNGVSKIEVLCSKKWGKGFRTDEGVLPGIVRPNDVNSAYAT